MSEKVLVTYGSKYGATEEIAAKVADILIDCGFLTDFLSARDVEDVSLYKAVILGSAVYIGQWHKDAVRFIKKNQTELQFIPFWIFSSGPTGEGSPQELVQGWQLPKNIQAIVDTIQPRGITVFHGDLKSDKISGIERWMIGKVNAPIGDFRNWQDITAWARSIADSLR